MTTLAITLLVLVAVPAAVVVYRVHQRTHELPRIPFGFGVAQPDGRNRGNDVVAARRLGPDADRIRSELVTLQLHHRDSA
ncbi:hypothetical protein [Gordonia soli]|uniref:hypothetical protein n=1 Tax=Gordonia soli TaxID=320799 RepID=UPI00034C2681|nr:hypothetical protein [Gordonia soli]